MFLQEILKDDDLNLIYDKYSNIYLNSISYENFMKVYKSLKKRKIYFIDDLIIRYLDIFTLDVNVVNEALDELHTQYGEDYIFIIGKNMQLLENEILKILER